MFKILKTYGIPDRLISAIGLMYEGTQARVITPDGETEFFSILAAVLQGDTLAPYLFEIILDYAMRKAIGGNEEELGFTLHYRRSRRHEPVILTDTDFADDIVTISEEMEQAQNMLSNIEIEGAKVGLRFNAKKTEMMLFNQNVRMDVMSRDGNKIKIVDNFKYLGGSMNSSEKKFKVRKAQAWLAFHKLKKIWSSNLSKKLFKTIYYTSWVDSFVWK